MTLQSSLVWLTKDHTFSSRLFGEQRIDSDKTWRVEAKLPHPHPLFDD
jgi:hypothetical protein